MAALSDHPELHFILLVWAKLVVNFLNLSSALHGINDSFQHICTPDKPTFQAFFWTIDKSSGSERLPRAESKHLDSPLQHPSGFMFM